MNELVLVVLQPWSEKDLSLLEKLLGNPDMMKYLGGPESQEQIYERHQRFLRLPESDQMFKIVLGRDSKAVGSIGFWEKTWRGDLVYETGWFVLPEFQGQGIATQAAEAIIARARLEHRHQFIHAFPSIHNISSNTICRKLGFSLIEECQFEYPPKHFMTVNDWRFDLFRK